MKQVTFEICEPPVGYTILMGRWGKRKTKYIEYKKLVQSLCPIELPLRADVTHPILVETQAYFEHGTHPDPENVHKGIKDALFYGLKGKGGGDKYTGGSYDPPLYDKENPRVIVTLWLPDDYDHRRDIAVVSDDLITKAMQSSQALVRDAVKICKQPSGVLL